MHQVSPGIINPAFIRDANGFRVVDFKQARKMLRNRLVSKNGQKMGTFTDGAHTWVACVPVFLSKRYNPKPQFASGESARMTPSRPTGGNIWSGTYARRLSGFVAEHKEAVALFNGWKPKAAVVPVQATADTVMGRSILYFPGAGPLTCKKTQPRKVALRATKTDRISKGSSV